jgi:16S rRNA U1498 N3-methylase RsmE
LQISYLGFLDKGGFFGKKHQYRAEIEDIKKQTKKLKTLFQADEKKVKKTIPNTFAYEIRENNKIRLKIQDLVRKL